MSKSKCALQQLYYVSVFGWCIVYIVCPTCHSFISFILNVSIWYSDNTTLVDPQKKFCKMSFILSSFLWFDSGCHWRVRSDNALFKRTGWTEHNMSFLFFFARTCTSHALLFVFDCFVSLRCCFFADWQKTYDLTFSFKCILNRCNFKWKQWATIMICLPNARCRL